VVSTFSYSGRSVARQQLLATSLLLDNRAPLGAGNVGAPDLFLAKSGFDGLSNICSKPRAPYRGTSLGPFVCEPELARCVHYFVLFSHQNLRLAVVSEKQCIQIASRSSLKHSRYFFLVLNNNCLRQSRGQQNRRKMSDGDNLRQLKYRYEDGPHLAAPPSSSRNIVTLLQLHLRRPCKNIDILPRRMYFSFDFAI